jgi:mannosyltransferase
MEGTTTEVRPAGDAMTGRRGPSRRATVISVSVLVALGVALRWYRIGSQPLWVDEATSLKFAHLSLGQLWSWPTVADPGNPPLYYTLLHWWIRFGDREGTLRLLSALFGLATIPVVYALGRTVRDHRLGVLAALLFTVSPFQVWYSQEARGYALLTFGASIAMLGVAWLLRHPERAGSVRTAGWALGAYVLGTAVALLSHDTAVLLLVGANVLMVGWWVVRRTPGFLRTWLLAQAAVVVLWASWLPAFASQVRGGAAYAWIPKPTVAIVRDAAYALWGGVTRGTPYMLELAVVAVLAGLGLWSWHRDRRWVAFVLTFLLAAPLGELAVSLWRPVFLQRTLVWTGVPLCLAMAAGLLWIRPRVVGALVLVGVLVLAGIGLRSYYVLNPKEAWDQVAAYVDGGVHRGDAIVFSESFLQIPFAYYDRAPASDSLREIGLTGTPEDVPLVLEQTRTRRRVWLIVSHVRPSADAVIAALGGEGQLLGVAQFTDVDVYLYDLGPRSG